MFENVAENAMGFLKFILSALRGSADSREPPVGISPSRPEGITSRRDAEKHGAAIVPTTASARQLPCANRSAQARELPILTIDDARD